MNTTEAMQKLISPLTTLEVIKYYNIIKSGEITKEVASHFCTVANLLCKLSEQQKQEFVANPNSIHEVAYKTG